MGRHKEDPVERALDAYYEMGPIERAGLRRALELFERMQAVDQQLASLDPKPPRKKKEIPGPSDKQEPVL